jgi:AraC-like DNA-binding protein
MTSGPAEELRLCDLKLPAQLLDVEALARGVNMSAGHLSRQFKSAYG